MIHQYSVTGSGGEFAFPHLDSIDSFFPPLPRGPNGKDACCCFAASSRRWKKWLLLLLQWLAVSKSVMTTTTTSKNGLPAQELTLFPLASVNDAVASWSLLNYRPFLPSYFYTLFLNQVHTKSLNGKQCSEWYVQCLELCGDDRGRRNPSVPTNAFFLDHSGLNVSPSFLTCNSSSHSDNSNNILQLLHVSLPLQSAAAAATPNEFPSITWQVSIHLIVGILIFLSCLDSQSHHTANQFSTGKYLPFIALDR